MRTLAAGLVVALALSTVPVLVAAPSVERTLPSGARALFVTRPGSGTVLTAVAVTAGAEDEPKERAGLSHFLEHLLFDGYDALDERGVTEAFERHSIYANAFTRGQTTVFIALAPKDEAKNAASMLLGMLMRSKIEPAAFEKEKKVILEELARDRSTPNGARDEALRAALWAGSPLEHAQGGTADGVAAITRDDVVSFWRTRYVPRGFRVLVIGDAPVEELEAVAAPFAAAPKPGAAQAPAAAERVPDSKYPGWGTWRASQPFLADDPQLQLVIAPPAGATLDAAALDRLADWLGDDRGPLAAALRPNLARRIGVSRLPRAPRDLLEISIEAAKDRTAKEVLDATLAALDASAGGPSDDDADRLAHAAVAQRAVEGQRLHYIAMLYGETFATLAGPLLPAIDPPRALGPAVRAAATALLGSGVRARTRAAWSGPDGPESAAALPQSVAPITTAAAVAPEQKPEPGPGASRVVTLPSGLVVASIEEPGSGVFGVQVLVADRALREPAGQPGIVDLAHRLVGSATKLSTGTALARRLQRLGLELKTADDPNIPYDDEDDVPDYSYLRLEGPATSLDEGLALLGEMLRLPDWDRAGWERAVASHEQERKVLAQGSLATSRALRARVLGAAHPLAKALAAPVGAPLPTEDEVRALFGSDMYFNPSRLIVAVVAPRGAGDVAARIADVFDGAASAPKRGPYPAPSPSAPEAKPADAGKPADAAKPTDAAKPADAPKPPAGMPGGMPGMPPGMGGMGKPAAQVTLAWGRVADVPEAERAPLALALSALSDRMVAVIREKEGLAYRLGAGARALPGGGWLISASVGTRPQNEARVRQIWDELTTALGTSPLAPAELERLAARARQKDMLGGLSAGQRASRLARLVFEGKGSPLGAGYADVKNVTPAQLQAAAAKWLAPAGWLATP